ncbi:response regulator transcription factor [Poseidonocella sp. HB161398]|uniref:response regulator transcription factor n=1 Tax=Poseidonocella sp. HB161398 TaxID=2320855 RepID=UPI0011098511|nr:response regulator transcription factor [Poseidonocella sp. HB161398]
MRRTTILVVDDEPWLREVLRTGLEGAGFDVAEAADRNGLREVLDSRTIDLITLDLRLGNEDGLELARDIRADLNIPILMISARTAPIDRVHGLECGADDYIVKPFLIREVILRIKKTLERYQSTTAQEGKLFFDHISFDPKRSSVTRSDGTPVELTGTELKLLELFLNHPGRILDRDSISRELYGHNWSPYSRTIDGHVARLRQKLGHQDETPPIIRSVRGVGYVLIGEVRDESGLD